MSVKYSSKKFAFDKPFKLAGRLVLEHTPADVGSISRSAWALNPIQFGTTKVLDDLAHQFLWYRFTKLRAVIASSSGTVGNSMTALCLLTYPPVTLPSSIDDIGESEFACFAWSGQTDPAEMTVGRAELGQGQPKWFRVEPTGDDYLEYQGYLVWGDTNQGVTTKYVILEYEVEFLGLVDDPLTPLAKRGPLIRPGMTHEPPMLHAPGSRAQFLQPRRRRLETGEEQEQTFVKVPPASPAASACPPLPPRAVQTEVAKPAAGGWWYPPKK
jgi:hypothetical protein